MKQVKAQSEFSLTDLVVIGMALARLLQALRDKEPGFTTENAEQLRLDADHLLHRVAHLCNMLDLFENESLTRTEETDADGQTK